MEGKIGEYSQLDAEGFLFFMSETGSDKIFIMFLRERVI